MQKRYQSLKGRDGLERLVKKKLSALNVESVNLGKLIAISRDRRRSEGDRCEAVELLGLLEFEGTLDKQTRPHVVRSLLRNFSEGKVKLSWCSAVSLGHLNSIAAVRPLMKVVRGAKQSEIRRAAIHCLGVLGDRKAAALLSRVLVNATEPPPVRAQAAEALTTCGRRSKPAIAALVSALRSKSVEVRFFSAFALGQCALLGGQIGGLAISGLQRLLKDRSVLKGFGSVAGEARKSLRDIRAGRPDDAK